MGIMAIGRIIILSALIAQALSAPSGCIESCNFFQTNLHQTSSGYRDHANLVQGRTNLNDYDYTKPGNWTEHNQFSTDDGHGRVHEERGQYVDESKTVKYYKKNFTASYGNVNGLGATELDELSGQRRYDSIHVPSSQHIDSQSAYGLGQTVTKETGYNRMHSQQTQSSSTRIDRKNERLEDFGEYGGYSQVNQHVPDINTQTIDTQHHVETVPNNWSRVDSYRTDGGHGRVFEEEGQYVTGPKKVRYYKKNYTSNYSSSIPQSSVGSATLDELHSKLQRDLQKNLDSFRRNYQVSSVGHTAATTHTDSTVGLTQEAVGFHDLQTAESDGYRQHLGYRGVPSGTRNVHHYTEQQRETLTDTRQLPSTYPTADTYGTESQRTYQSHESHISRVHPQSSHLSSSYVQIPRSDYQSSYHNTHSSEHQLDETHRAEALSAHQSSVLQNQLLTENSQRVYNPHSSHLTYSPRRGETRHYEEHWRSSSQTGGIPERTITDHSGSVGHAERTHYDRDAYNEHRGRYHNAQGYESHARTSGSSYDSAYRTNSGQLVTGSLDLGHAAHGADCTEETHQQYQHESRYHRKYKRDGRHVQQHRANEDFMQQNQESQQMEDLTQQSEQFTQQTQGSDDLTQQTSGKLEFGQQTIDNHHLDDLTQQSEQFTQQTEGQLEFGQQTVGNPHLEDLTQQNEQFTQQTQGSDDLTQQTSGKLEFGQQTIDNHHLDDLTQQSEQFTQQTEGQLEFGQQTVGNPHLEDLTQQNEQFTQQTQGSDDLTQQTSGKLEFGQQTIDNHHLDDLTQQSEQFTQQTEGQLEFGQQTVGNPHLEDLTQQNEQFTQQTQGSDDLTQQTSGKLEFGQQTIDNHHLDDLTQQSEQFTQQTEGQLEFGQQTIGNPHLEDLTQQNEQFTQQTQGSDDLTQQTSGKLEFGQQTIDNHRLNDDLTQQSEQFTQQTEGQLEFGQQIADNSHFEDLTQTQESDFAQQTGDKLEFGQQTVDTKQLEQFAQRTARSDDLTQQIQLGKHELGQHVNNNKRLDDLTEQSEQFLQQTEGQLEFGQQTVGNQYLENSKRLNEQFAQQTVGSDDFTQQSVGKMEFGQQMQSIDRSAKPKSQRLEEFNEQSEDFSQQTGRFHDYTQQTMGHLEFGQPHRSNNPRNHHSMEDFTQQNQDITQQTGGFGDFSQETAGHSEYGQQREQQRRPSWPKYNARRLEHHSQQNEWDTDNLSQQSYQYPSYGNDKQSEWQLEQVSRRTNLNQDFTQRTDQDQLATGVKPAPKPKPRPRYQKHNFIPSHTDGTDTNVDNIFKSVEVKPEADIDNMHERIIESGSHVTHPGSNQHTSKVSYTTHGSSMFDNQKENMDRLHWVHKSNDATVGLQWHYTYHPSDLTNVESSHDNYYPRQNVDSMSQQTEDIQQQSKPFDFSQQETQSKDTSEDKHQNSYISQSSQHDKYDQQPGLFQQIEPSRFNNQDSDQTPSKVIPLQRENYHLTEEQEKRSAPTTEQTGDKPEERILQAYGGGPYDASRNDDFYNRVRPNPNATLPPMDGDDSWDIREKPKEPIRTQTRSTIRNVPEIATTEVAETTMQTMETTTQPSFWSRVGHKITNTYDKAKEKAKEIFG